MPNSKTSKLFKNQYQEKKFIFKDQEIETNLKKFQQGMNRILNEIMPIIQKIQDEKDKKKKIDLIENNKEILMRFTIFNISKEFNFDKKNLSRFYYIICDQNSLHISYKKFNVLCKEIKKNYQYNKKIINCFFRFSKIFTKEFRKNYCLKYKEFSTLRLADDLFSNKFYINMIENELYGVEKEIQKNYIDLKNQYNFLLFYINDQRKNTFYFKENDDFFKEKIESLSTLLSFEKINYAFSTLICNLNLESLCNINKYPRMFLEFAKSDQKKFNYLKQESRPKKKFFVDFFKIYLNNLYVLYSQIQDLQNNHQEILAKYTKEKNLIDYSEINNNQNLDNNMQNSKIQVEQIEPMIEEQKKQKVDDVQEVNRDGYCIHPKKRFILSYELVNQNSLKDMSLGIKENQIQIN